MATLHLVENTSKFHCENCKFNCIKKGDYNFVPLNKNYLL